MPVSNYFRKLTLKLDSIIQFKCVQIYNPDSDFATSIWLNLIYFYTSAGSGKAMHLLHTDTGIYYYKHGLK